MTLKSLEVKNLSWWISVQCWNLFKRPAPPPILLFHISSDQCWEFSNSNRRSFFFLQNSIAPSSSRGRSDLAWHSSWFCFSLWSAHKSKYIRFQRKFFRLHLRSFLLVVVVLFVAQVRDQLIQTMRNSDPRVRFIFHSIFTLQVTGCDFQHGSNFGVPSNSTFQVRRFFISWQGVLTTCHLFCKLWEFFSVFCHDVLSDFNCCHPGPRGPRDPMAGEPLLCPSLF